MATTTTNLGLTKPTTSESADISVINGNMDIIDSTYPYSQTFDPTKTYVINKGGNFECFLFGKRGSYAISAIIGLNSGTVLKEVLCGNGNYITAALNSDSRVQLSFDQYVRVRAIFNESGFKFNEVTT